MLKETLAYEVDRIDVVLPQEAEGLDVIEGGDYVTLVTCLSLIHISSQG